MADLEQALKAVGLKLSRSPHRKRKKNMKRMLDKVFAPLTKKRTIQIQCAGSHYKARWRGSAAFCFGITASEAENRLRCGRLGRSLTGKQLYGKFADNE